MKKVFVDTDILYDLLAERMPFYPHAATLFTLADRKKVEIYVSAQSFANIHYILTKQKSADETRKILARLRMLVRILAVDDKIIDLALNSDFKDFEDAIQYYCSLENGIRVLLTRNLKDYKKADIPVMTAETFIKN